MQQADYQSLEHQSCRRKCKTNSLLWVGLQQVYFQIGNLRMRKKLILLFIIAFHLLLQARSACTLERCCLASTCTNTYCQQSNSQTWISSESFSSYGYTKLVLSNGSCLPCPFNCQTCASQTTCSTCASGFYMSGTSCVICGYMCSTCVVVNSISKCSVCSGATYLDSSTASCKNCGTGAALCSSATVISQCKTGYYLTSNSMFCLACPSNCQSCPSSNNICSGCYSGYYLSSSQCFACTLANCSTCSFFAGNQFCISCATGYFVSGGKCFSCSSNCNRCTNATNCLTCALGYYIISAACLPATTITDNCNTYQNTTSCATCLTTYYLSDSKCYPCSILCTACYGLHFGACTACATNAYLFNQMCLPTKYLSNSQYQLYYSLPSGSSLLAQGSQDCNHYLYSATSVSLSLRDLSASKVTIKWRLFSVGGSTSYALGWTNSGGTVNYQFTTSASGGQAYPLCSSSSTLYYLSLGQQQISSVKISNTLAFSTNNGVVLALQEVLLAIQMCNSLCIECTETACTQCLMPNLYTQDASCVYTCSSGYYIYQNVSSATGQNACLQQCPTGTYALSTNLSCVPCTAPCLSCLNPSYCLSCVADYYLTNQNTCLQVCPYQYFGQALTKTCQKCVGRCNQCLDQQRCLNCNQGFYYASNYSCLDSCDSSNSLTGMYANLSTLNCEPCSATCLNCLFTSTYCTSCNTGLVFYDHSCISSCPTGYYANNIASCVACVYPCEACSLLSSNCTSCLDGYLLENSCVTDCPDGYFEDNSVLSCTACNSACQKCISSSSYCSVCKAGNYLFNNTCISSCPGQFYANSTSKVCQACTGSCYTCINDTYCLSCSTNFLLNGECVSSISCPAQMYADIISLACLPCSSNCLTCQVSGSRCSSCNHNSSQPLLEKESCVASCSSNTTFPSISAGKAICASCISPCLTCTSATYCLSCVQGYMYSAGSCSTSCTAGYYFDSGTSSCQGCSSGCLSCSNSLFCQVCQTGKYIKSINSTANQCVSDCGTQQYVSLVSSSCRACLYPCLNCTSNVDCSSCQEGALYLSRCLSTCPDTTFLDVNGTICSPCSGNCLTCSQASTHCLTCLNSYYLSTINNNCIASCPSGTYAQNVTQMCLECPSTCSQCSNSTYCLACVTNRTYLYTLTNICIADCPLGYFANTSSTVCDPCQAKCITCSGTSYNCLSCAQNFYLVRMTVSTYDCVTSCPHGYYQESQNCQPCIFPCSTCSSASACLTCVLGTYFYSNTSACLLACPSNTYLNYSASICTLCTSPCASCRSDKYCLSCLNNLYLQNGECVISCPGTYYPDTTQLCIQCSGLCKTCSSKFYCLSCITGYMSNGYCYSSCPAGTFADINTTSCIACVSPCLECSFSTTYCTRCTGGLVQFQGSCSSSCPLGTYLSDGSCLSCQFPCVNCTGPQLCTECLGGYLLYNGMTCINQTTYCPNDLYKMDGKYCIPKAQCPSSYYTDSDLKTCSSSCSPSKYVFNPNRSCLYSCEDSQYVGVAMVCQYYATDPPISLMGMTVISFIKSNIIHIVVSFNQSATWMTGATDIYSLNPTTSTSTSRLLVSSTLGYNMDSSSPGNLILKVGDVPNQIWFTLPASNVVSSSTNYPLQTPNVTLTLPSFVTYDYGIIYQGLLASQFGFGLGWFILLLSLLYLFKNRISHLYTLWDTVQLLYVIILLQIQYPPALNEFLNGLQTTLFINFPNVFSQGLQRTSSARPFYAYTYDNNFLRNAGPSLTIGIIVIIIYVFFKLAAQLNRRVDKVKAFLTEYPKIKRFMYETLLRFRWHYVSDVIFLTYLSVFLFAVAELYNMAGNPGRGFSNGCCVVSTIIYLIFPIFAGVKLHRHFPNIKKGKHSQNLRCFYRGIDKTSQFGVFLIMIRYFRKVVYAIVIPVFSSRPMYALPILMFTSVLMALFIFLNLPFKKRLSNIVQIINECCIAFLFLGIALINFNNQQKYTGFNVGLGYACTGLLIFILLLLVFEVFCRSLFKLKSQQEIRKENELKLEEMSESQLRRKAGEFFDLIFPRIKKQLGFGEDSDDQSYKYQEGDSQNSENNLRREEEWGIRDQDENSDEFRHYDGSQSEEATEGKQKAPEYLIRCVKQLQ